MQVHPLGGAEQVKKNMSIALAALPLFTIWWEKNFHTHTGEAVQGRIAIVLLFKPPTLRQWIYLWYLENARSMFSKIYCAKIFTCTQSAPWALFRPELPQFLFVMHPQTMPHPFATTQMSKLRRQALYWPVGSSRVKWSFWNVLCWEKVEIHTPILEYSYTLILDREQLNGWSYFRESC